MEENSHLQAFETFLQQKGIIHQTGPSNTPNLNPQERHNRTLNQKQRALLLDAKLGPSYWVFAREVAQHLKNLTPTQRLKHANTPFEAFHGRQPDLRMIRSFGCICYAHVNKPNHPKHSPTSVRGIFVGYDVARRGYKVLIDNNRKLIVSRNVTFNEGEHVHSAMGGAQAPQLVKQVGMNAASDDDSDDGIIEWRSIQRPQLDAMQPYNVPQTPPHNVQQAPPQLEKKQSFKTLQHLAQQMEAHNDPAAAQPKLQKLEKQLQIDMAFLTLPEYAYVVTADEGIPQSYDDVVKSASREEWLQAVDRECSALEQMRCFGPQQDLPDGCKATNTSFLFVIKSDGQKKARLVYRNNPYSWYGGMTVIARLLTGQS
jgi:hypothetical protein